jgi:hypothetical protein
MQRKFRLLIEDCFTGLHKRLIGDGFYYHKAMPVSMKKRTEKVRPPSLLQCNAGSFLLTGCSPAEPVSSSTSCYKGKN